MEEILTLSFLFVFCATKFFIAVPAVLIAGYSYWETILISSSGGIAGFFVFFYIGEMKLVRLYLGKIIDWLLGLFGISLATKERKTFSKKTRFIVKVKGRYGIIGLALLTPSVFSIPLGSLIAARYFDDNKITIPVMLFSIVLWSFGITSFYTLF